MTGPATSKRPAWFPFAVVGGSVLVIAALWALLPTSSPPRMDTPRETFTLTGQVVVPARVEAFVPDNGCIGELGYTDIQPGAVVTVYSASGTSVATGTLTAGQMKSTRCAYGFTITGVPRGEGSYQVEVGSRGRAMFDESVLIANGASLTLG